MESPDAAVAERGDAWGDVRDVLARLLAGMEFGEVIELAAAGSFYLEVGRMPSEIWLLASGPPTPELQVGQVDPVLRKHLREIGFRRPDKDKPSWWVAVDMPAEPDVLAQAAGQAVRALQSVDGVTLPDDLVWSHIVAKPGTRELAGQLGIPRSPSQNAG
ncbi:MAG: hypothetical protein WCB04_02530 [Mycobacteriales bacterium]